ncbi:ABC transporter substrate-binding protein [Pseudoalteromonas distincta]|uniref:ABC transporter substrate-binding protein n=1 Tax=Pseudoalteromonas distincta TaxID=77608 RepID=UPI0032E1448A
MNKRVIWNGLIASILLFNSIVSAKTDLEIAILVSSGEQRTIMSSFINKFGEQNTDINLKLTMLPDAEYKVALKKWLDEGKGPAVINWQAGERLFQYVRNNQVTPINGVWDEHNLRSTFTQSSLKAVSHQDYVYGLPISYYQWGFYYRKSIFNKLNITTPETWGEFLEVCSILKQNGIMPITIGNKYKWPSAAWFDYLNLRINGLEFHSALLRGDESFKDPRVRRVFEHWQHLVENDYFVSYNPSLKWDEAMPFLYHKLSGMTLIGNFFAGRMPLSLKDDFGFFKFPIIDKRVELYEEAPLDIFIVPHYQSVNDAVERFLVFISKTEFQKKLNYELDMISPNINVPPSEDYFSQVGQQVLAKAQGVSQYFDRDTNAQMSDQAVKIFAQFIVDKDIDNAIEQLERVRQTFSK